MPNIYNHIDSNKKDTAIIVTLFIFFITLLVWFLGQIYAPDAAAMLLVLALTFSVVTSFVSYYNSDKIVLSISGAHEVSYEENPDLHKLVENMSIASGLPKPKVYMIDDTSMNAFATGRDPNHSAICVTSGIVSRLEKRELEGVIAHEMSHIGNYDIRLMSIVTILVGTVTLVADWFTRGSLYRGSGRSRSSKSEGSGIILLLGLLLIIISPIIATLIKLAISRKREYLADSTAALITRYPQGLANALRKLSADTEILEAANGATAHLYISAPIRSESSKFFSSLFNTHPPIEDRIARLESM